VALLIDNASPGDSRAGNRLRVKNKKQTKQKIQGTIQISDLVTVIKRRGFGLLWIYFLLLF
jgi:hypothetical protein